MLLQFQSFRYSLRVRLVRLFEPASALLNQGVQLFYSYIEKVTFCSTNLKAAWTLSERGAQHTVACWGCAD